MTKNIKLVEQETLAQKFQAFRLDQTSFVAYHKKDTNIYKKSKMQPISKEADTLDDYLGQNGYDNLAE